MKEITEQDIINCVHLWCANTDIDFTHEVLIPSGFVSCYADLPAVFRRTTSVPVFEKYGHPEIQVLFSGLLVEKNRIKLIQATCVYDWNEKKIIKTFGVIETDKKI